MKNNPAYLYHGTGIYCLARVVETNTLSNVAHPESADEHPMLRLTDNFHDAASLIASNLPTGEGGILVLDRKSLSETYDLVETQNELQGGDSARDQSGVLALAKEISPLSEHLISIVCDPQIIKLAMFRHHMEDAYSNSGWPPAWGTPLKSPGRQKMVEAFDIMTVSPFLNAESFTPEGYPSLRNWTTGSASEWP